MQKSKSVQVFYFPPKAGDEVWVFGYYNNKPKKNEQTPEIANFFPGATRNVMFLK